MARYFLFIFLLLVGLFTISCTRTEDTRLTTAEQLIQTAPDSSLHLLQQINNKSIHGSYNRALYALLMSQAMDKNDIKLETDSLITLATNYFDDTDPVHAGYAWFYHARTANNRDSVNERANNLLKAQEYAEKTDNYKLIGLVYGEKGQMYKNQQQYDSSICYFKKAFYSLKYLQDSRNQVLCLFYIGDNFLYLSKCDSALKYYKTAENFLIHSNDTLILSSFYRNFGSGYFQLNDFKQALRYYKLVPDTKIPIYDSNKYYLIAKTYIQI